MANFQEEWLKDLEQFLNDNRGMKSQICRNAHMDIRLMNKVLRGCSSQLNLLRVLVGIAMLVTDAEFNSLLAGISKEICQFATDYGDDFNFMFRRRN